MISNRDKEIKKIPDLTVLIDKTSGEIMGYGFTKMTASSSQQVVYTNGERVRTLELRDNEKRKKIAWSFDSNDVVDIIEKDRKPVQEKSSSSVSEGWSKMKTDEKLDCLANLLGVKTT